MPLGLLQPLVAAQGRAEADRVEGRAAGKCRNEAQSGRSVRNEVGRGVGLR